MLANDVFKHGDDRREARKCHEQEEQRSPHAAARHAGEDIGQGDENQARSGIRRDAVGKTGGENNQPRADGHKRIQRADAHGFAGQRVFAAHITAENLHRANAKAEREERLIHGRSDHAADSLLHRAPPVGQQKKRQSLFCAGKCEAMYGQHGDEHNQRAHHRLGDALHAVLQAKAANGEAKHNGQRHVAAHFAGAGKHLPKHAGNPHRRSGR